MSNCINFDGELNITPTKTFWDIYNRSRDKQPDQEKDNIGNGFWWFMPDIKYVGNISFASFIPGSARSSHTWRDARWLFRTLKDLGCNPQGTFTCYDESDGFEEPFTASVETFLND